LFDFFLPHKICFSGKANNVADLQKEQDEVKFEELYKKIKKEVKDKRAVLQILLQGDIQRTKNVLQDHPNYQRVYYGKQSYEVLDELNYKAFLKRKKLARYMSEHSSLMKQYEDELVRFFPLMKFI
jgi:transcription initiation factor IIE alpha subunit